MFDFLFNPQGRISRKGFWLGFFLPYLAISILLGLGERGVPLLGIVSTLVGLFYLWPSFVAVPVKRLHDLGRSGWWLLLFYVLVFAAMLAFGFAVAASMAGSDGLDPNAFSTMTPAEQQALLIESIGPALSNPLGLFAAVALGILVVAYYVVLGILPGQRADNRYGRDPHAEGRGFAD